MNVLLSIKPQYAEAITSGQKRYEFRRSVFRQRVKKAYIYSTSPVGKIVASFEIEDVICGCPRKIWSSCRREGGISKKEFFTYFKNSNKAFAIRIGKVSKFSSPIDPNRSLRNFTPPQSFYYVKSDIRETGFANQNMIVSSIRRFLTVNRTYSLQNIFRRGD